MGSEQEGNHHFTNVYGHLTFQITEFPSLAQFTIPRCTPPMLSDGMDTLGSPAINTFAKYQSVKHMDTFPLFPK